MLNIIRIGVAQVPPTSVLSKNLEKTLEYAEKAADKEVELLCFPEAYLAGYRVGYWIRMPRVTRLVWRKPRSRLPQDAVNYL